MTLYGSGQSAPDSNLDADEVLRRAESRRFVPKGSAVGLMPTRDKKLNFETGDSEVDNRLRGMIENLLHLSPYAMCITDMQKPDEPIVYANEMFCTWTEYPEDYIVGRNCRFLQGPATDPATVKAMRTAIKEGSEFRGIVRNYSRTGIHLWNNLVMRPIKNARGFVTHYTGIQSFSHEPPNEENTPAPQVMAFNPLAQHLNLKINVSGPSGALDPKEVAKALMSDLEQASGRMSPKILPKAGEGIRDETMDDTHGESPKRPKGRQTDLPPPSALNLMSKSGVEETKTSLPLQRKIEDDPTPGSPKKMKGDGGVGIPSNGGSETTTPGSKSAGAMVRRSRPSTIRRQGGECSVLPDKDVWLELVMRSFSPENVPHLPPPAATPERSTAMTIADFNKAQKSIGIA
uniref:Putative LOV domain-containing protein n=1 Tax=Coleochaete irregularis TaxID=187194 RepID=A0A126X108_COLIR|nr:putative LOV domain-containing protein [Coleochaete irregularis]